MIEQRRGCGDAQVTPPQRIYLWARRCIEADADALELPATWTVCFAEHETFSTLGAISADLVVLAEPDLSNKVFLQVVQRALAPEDAPPTALVTTDAAIKRRRGASTQRLR